MSITFRGDLQVNIPHGLHDLQKARAYKMADF
jgi:hypothetical protein